MKEKEENRLRITNNWYIPNKQSTANEELNTNRESSKKITDSYQLSADSEQHNEDKSTTTTMVMWGNVMIYVLNEQI